MNTRLLYALPPIVLAMVALALAITGLLIREPAADAQVTQAPAEAEAPTPHEHQYLLASRVLSTGDALSRDAFKVVISSEVIPEAISANDAPFGKPIGKSIVPGELLMAASLEPQSLLQRLVTPGYQALAIPVDDVSSVGGLLRPGDRVDVMASFRRSDKDKPAALRVLKNVLVLAVKGVSNVEQAKGSADSHRNSTVVLEIPESKVSELLLASTEGQLRLSAVAAASEPAIAEHGSSGNAVAGAVYINELFPSTQKAEHHRSSPPAAVQVQVFEGSESRYVYVR